MKTFVQLAPPAPETLPPLPAAPIGALLEPPAPALLVGVEPPGLSADAPLSLGWSGVAPPPPPPTGLSAAGADGPPALSSDSVAAGSPPQPSRISPAKAKRE
jgi:hypothetical protein